MTVPLGEVAIKSSITKSYLSIVSFFVHWKSIFFLPTFKEFGVNSIYKYASTTRLKSKTFALQYLGQKSSKLSPKPLVRKLISLSFRRHFWLWQYFWSAAFIWPQTTMYLTTRTFRTLWARQSQYKPAVKIIVKQSESKSREIWRARFLDMITRLVFRPVGKKKTSKNKKTKTKKKKHIYIYIYI